MAKSIQSLVSFAGGEVSPILSAQISSPKYQSSCLQCRNIIPLKTGPATRRPGTQFEGIAAIPTVIPGGYDWSVRLEPFIFSETTSFMMEFGTGSIRFYSNGQQVVLSTAPAWNALTNYTGGQFVTDPTDSLIYYSLGGGVSATQPHLDSTNWRQQTAYELPSPYKGYWNALGGETITDAEVFQLQCCQINDVVYIVHPKHPRYKLTRFADTNWVLEQVADNVPPMLDQNATDTTLAASGVTGSVTLTATAPAWTTATFYEVGRSTLSGGVLYQATTPHVSAAAFATDLAAGRWVVQVIFPLSSSGYGQYYQLAYKRPVTNVQIVGTAAAGFANGSSSAIKCLGKWEVRTYGVWSADIALETSFNSGVTWETIRVLTSRSDANFDLSPYSGVATVEQSFRLTISNNAVPSPAGTTNPRVIFECIDNLVYGLVQITARTSDYIATATVITPLYDTSATPLWSEGAWSYIRGFPGTITTFQQRVLCGGTDFQPQRIWGTKIDDLENWGLGTSVTDGLAFDIDAVGEGRIFWMNSQQDLYCGMARAEFIVGPEDTTTAFSATNLRARRQSAWGSNKNVRGIVIGDALVYPQSQGLTLRQMVFTFQTNKYMSEDLTTLSESILNAGVIQLAFQKQFKKNGILWATTLRGELVGMTYELGVGVYGWHRHFTGGGGDKFLSVAVIPGKGNNDDEVWVVVKRQIPSGSGVYIERLNPTNWENINGSAQKSEAYFVDAGKTYRLPGSNVFTGLSHLETKTVVACIEGQTYSDPSQIVTGGSVTIPNFTPAGFETVHIGLPFTSTLQPMNIDVDGRIGPTQSLEKKVTGLTLMLYNTLTCTYGDGIRPFIPLTFRNTSNIALAPQLFSGKRQIKDFPGDVSLDNPIIIQTDDPLPLTVLAVAVAYSITGIP